MRWRCRFKILDLASNGHFQSGLRFSPVFSPGPRAAQCKIVNEVHCDQGRGGGRCQAANNVSTASPQAHHLASTAQLHPSHYIRTLSRVSHAKSYLSHYLYDLKTISELILRDTNGLHVCNIILGSSRWLKNLLLNFQNVLMKSDNGKRRGLTN